MNEDHEQEQREQDRRWVFWRVVWAVAIACTVILLCGDWARGQ